MKRRSFKTLIIATCTALLSTAVTAESFRCIEPGGHATTRVIGGAQMTSRDAPYQVALITKAEGDKPGSLCGGSLISRGHVLTAAHCVSDWPKNGTIEPRAASRMFVLHSGDKIEDMAENRNIVGVERVFVHPRYNQDGIYSNDIAVLKLARNLDVPRDAIIQLASARMEQALAPAQTCARVTGYGRTETGKSSERMLGANLFIRPIQDCHAFAKKLDRAMNFSLSKFNKTTNAGPIIHSSMMCAGFESGGASSCKGDSGGPLVVAEGPNKWVQVGVVSWGNPGDCAATGAYGVYSKVSEAIPWIMEVARK